jgi:antitoxin MazE
VGGKQSIDFEISRWLERLVYCARVSDGKDSEDRKRRRVTSRLGWGITCMLHYIQIQAAIRHLPKCRNILDTGAEKMKASVKKWGNTAAVRIPAVVLEAAHVEIDQEVDIREEAGRIVIEPVRERKYKLGDLLKGITKDNAHQEIDFGSAEGREGW